MGNQGWHIKGQMLTACTRATIMHFWCFLAIFELMSDSLAAIQVEPHQCPLHHSILLSQGPIHEILADIAQLLAMLKIFENFF